MRNYGISRIDQPEKNHHGFYVRITHKVKRTQKFFPDKANGGKTKALKKATEYRDSAVAKLPKSKRDAIAQRRPKIKQSGVVGVTHVVSKGRDGKKTYEYWQASWGDSSGARKTAKFSTSRHGENEALEMAKKALKKGKRKK